MNSESINIQKGKCVIFSAPSGAGKTTIVHHLLNRNFGLEFSVSACCRQKRNDEVHGQDYYFLTIEEFREKIKKDEFLEWQEVYRDNYYGTLRSEINRIWEKGGHVIFDVDVVGGVNLKKYFGKTALSIFVNVPDLSYLEKRLRQRSTETPESIARRMEKAAKEIRYAEQFDHIIMNDNLENAFAEAERIVGTFLNES